MFKKTLILLLITVCVVLGKQIGDSSCQPVLCKKLCPFGFARNRLGCEICECIYIEDPNLDEAGACRPVLCKKFCKAGFAINKFGCEICQCLPQEIDIGKINLECPPVCKIFCKFGNVRDRSGCPICKCNPAPSIIDA